MKRLAGCVLAAVLASTTLAACGSATVEDESTSVAPLSKTASSTPSQSKKSKATQEQAEQTQDRPAQEIDQVPEEKLVLSKQDSAYLDQLDKDGVDTKGVERELLTVASLVCSEDGSPMNSATVQAVAGQLVEQGKTDKDFEQTAQALEASAKKAYCA
ncbi:DUF732 domain-containing protein [Corynebacterium pseudopelargi]|uniref:Uncharacterized protein n=1 Tax=Corynebacterium pseudopelargi TaxID=2080757 RepID=A0A3G6IRW5_9CORY|nr:DUF732 domain-containing protein [Corynebacterium pseudopelargi]AZA08322.1 hypothetical protein CPPEL_00870 [Corynebacterium pseudopelargi]